MKILITGASGFLGSALARRLGELNFTVSLLVRKNTNLFRIPDLGQYKVGRCETNLEIEKFIANDPPDFVIHTACCYGRNKESIAQLVDSNIHFGIVILEAINKLQKKISFLNAASVLPDEVSFYALTKNQFERLGMKFCSSPESRIQFINIKLQHIYGPSDDDTKFTSFVIHSCKKNVPTLPLTLGEQKRDFIYIDDVVDGYLKVLENAYNFGRKEQIELGSGHAVSIRDFVELAHKATNSSTHLGFGQIPSRENDALCLVANPKILRNLGWSPKFTIESGIKKMIQMEEIS